MSAELLDLLLTALKWIRINISAGTKEAFENIHKVKQMDEGPAVIVKRKVNGPNGRVRPAPRLLDSNKSELKVAVGNGSKVRVQYNEYSGEGKFGPYTGLDLQAVQVLDLVPYKNDDGSEFFEDGEEF